MGKFSDLGSEDQDLIRGQFERDMKDGYFDKHTHGCEIRDQWADPDSLNNLRRAELARQRGNNVGLVKPIGDKEKSWER